MGRFYNVFFSYFYPYKAFEDAWSLIYESDTFISYSYDKKIMEEFALYYKQNGVLI